MAVLGLWVPREQDGTANAYVSEQELRGMIAGGTPRRAYVIDGDESLGGAFTARRYRAESGERIVRIDSVATTSEATERELYEWLSSRPQEFNGVDAIDVWPL